MILNSGQLQPVSIAVQLHCNGEILSSNSSLQIAPHAKNILCYMLETYRDEGIIETTRSCCGHFFVYHVVYFGKLTNYSYTV